MRRDFARWLAVGLLSVGIALGSAPRQPSAKTLVFSAQGDPGNGGGGGG